MSTVLYYLAAALGFGLLIAFHEFGHYWVARRNGMRVERFAIGFGPAIFARKFGETEWVIGAIPVGGYVKVSGMSTEDDVAPDDERSYANKPAWRRLLVIGAGPAANYLLAYAIGVPLLLLPYSVVDMEVASVGTVVAGSPAEASGLRPSDRIVKVAETPVTTFESLTKVVPAEAAKSPGQPLPFTLVRDGTNVVVPVTPRDAGGGRYTIGISPGMKTMPALPLSQAAVQAGLNLWEGTKNSLTMLWKMIRRETSAQLSGPIGILSDTAKMAERGFMDFVMMVWSISLAVGLFNLLPFPGLDGGRIVFLGYEVLARRRVDQRIEGYIHAAGILALLLLIAVVSYKDIVRLFAS